jgi:hypothetical protein
MPVNGTSMQRADDAGGAAVIAAGWSFRVGPPPGTAAPQPDYRPADGG